jgi:hypothetical protein
VLGIGYPDPYLGGRPDRYPIWVRAGQTDTWILGRYLGSIWVSVYNIYKEFLRDKYTSFTLITTQNTNISINSGPNIKTVDLSIDWLIDQPIWRRDGERDCQNHPKRPPKTGPPQNPGTQILPEEEAR